MIAVIGMFSRWAIMLASWQGLKLVLIVNGVHSQDTDLARVSKMQEYLPYLETALNFFLSF